MNSKLKPMADKPDVNDLAGARLNIHLLECHTLLKTLSIEGSWISGIYQWKKKSFVPDSYRRSYQKLKTNL